MKSRTVRGSDFGAQAASTTANSGVKPARSRNPDSRCFRIAVDTLKVQCDSAYVKHAHDSVRTRTTPTVQFTDSTNLSRAAASFQRSSGSGSPLSLSVSPRAADQSRATSAPAFALTGAGGAARSMTPDSRTPPSSTPAKPTAVAETAVSA